MPPGRIYCSGKQFGLGLTEQTRKQRYQSDTDEGHAATGHQLYNAKYEKIFARMGLKLIKK